MSNPDRIYTIEDQEAQLQLRLQQEQSRSDTQRARREKILSNVGCALGFGSLGTVIFGPTAEIKFIGVAGFMSLVFGPAAVKAGRGPVVRFAKSIKDEIKDFRRSS